MPKCSTKLGDIFGQVYNDQRLKMSDIFMLMINKPASASRVREGDYGYEDLRSYYGDHMEFYIVVHGDDVYTVGCGATYAEIVDVQQAAKKTL